MAPKGKHANKGTSSTALPRVDSSAPTALLAPDDYEHLYAAGKGKEKAVKVVKGQSDSLADAGNSDAPTALIAPQDYAHIFCAEPTLNKKVPPKNAKEDKRIPSDAPTALINEITKQKAKSTVGKPAAKDTKAKAKPKAADGGGRTHASTKPVASKAARRSSNSRMESSSKHENEDGEEEGSGCACLII